MTSADHSAAAADWTGARLPLADRTDSRQHSGVSSRVSGAGTRTSAAAAGPAPLRPVSETPPPPHSTRHATLVYCVFYLLGMTTLLPWNFFITAHAYWQYKFRNTSQSPGADGHQPATQLQYNFVAYLSVASMLPLTLFLALNTLFSTLVDHQVKTVTSLTLVTILFVVTTALVEVDTDGWQTSFFYLTMTLVVLISAAVAIFQGGLFGLSAQFPVHFFSAVISGQALGAVFVCVVNILCIALPKGESDGFGVRTALIFFILADLTLLLAIAAFLWLSRTPLYRHYTSQCRPSRQTLLSGQVSVWRVLRQVRWYALSLVLLFAVTLALFPTVAAKVRVVGSTRTPSIWSRYYFTPVFCFLWFNLGDYAGRLAGDWVLWPPPGAWRRMLLLVLARVGFFPLLMYCNLDHRRISTVFDSDVYYVVFMALFALSNGYLATLSLRYGPGLVATEERDTASSMMATALSVGLCVGAALSTAVVRLL